ncbi:MAG: hypothetical protein ABSB96_08850 [Gaiellaceae bacterium]
MHSRISRLQKRSAVGITIAVVLALTCGIAFATTMSNGTYEPQLGAVIPAEKSIQVEHSLPSEESETQSTVSTTALVPAPAPPPVFDRIPGHVLSADTPVPVSPELIDVKNGWLASDGKTLVAVYAGAAGDDASNGRFVIVRQLLDAGRQTVEVVDVPGAGAVSITDAPKGAAVETTAQRGRIGFRGSRGRSGDLDLSRNETSVQ